MKRLIQRAKYIHRPYKEYATFTRFILYILWSVFIPFTAFEILRYNIEIGAGLFVPFLLMGGILTIHLINMLRFLPHVRHVKKELGYKWRYGSLVGLFSDQNVYRSPLYDLYGHMGYTPNHLESLKEKNSVEMAAYLRRSKEYSFYDAVVYERFSFFTNMMFAAKYRLTEGRHGMVAIFPAYFNDENVNNRYSALKIAGPHSIMVRISHGCEAINYAILNMVYHKLVLETKVERDLMMKIYMNMHLQTTFNYTMDDKYYTQIKEMADMTALLVEDVANMVRRPSNDQSVLDEEHQKLWEQVIEDRWSAIESISNKLVLISAVCVQHMNDSEFVLDDALRCIPAKDIEKLTNTMALISYNAPFTIH